MTDRRGGTMCVDNCVKRKAENCSCERAIEATSWRNAPPCQRGIVISRDYFNRSRFASARCYTSCINKSVFSKMLKKHKTIFMEATMNWIFIFLTCFFKSQIFLIKICPFQKKQMNRIEKEIFQSFS